MTKKPKTRKERQAERALLDELTQWQRDLARLRASRVG